MVEVANLSARLSAESSSYNAALKRARGELTKTAGTVTRGARKIDNKLSTAFKNAARNVAAFQGPLGGIAGRITSVGAIFGNVGLAVGGFTLAIAGLGFAMVKASKEAQIFERSSLRIQAVLKATGSASGLTALEIREFSRELAYATLASAEGVEKAAGQLLIFKSISGNTFKRTLTLAQDLAEVMNVDISSSIVRLGRLLEKPTSNFSTLTRAGVEFSKAQQDVISNFIDTGKHAEAQNYILDQVASKVGGAGKLGGLTSDYDTLSQAVSEFWQSLNNTVAAEYFQKTAKGLSIVLQGAAKAIDPEKFKKLSERTREAHTEFRELTKELKVLQALDATNLSSGYESSGAKQLKEEIKLLKAHIVALLNLRKARAAEKAEAIASAKAHKDAAEVERIEAKNQKERDARFNAAKKISDKLTAQRESTISGLQREKSGLEILDFYSRRFGESLSDGTVERKIYLTQQKLQIGAYSEEGKRVAALIRDNAKLEKSINYNNQIAGIKAETAAIIAHGMALKDSNVTLEEAELQKNILLALADAGISAASEEGKAFAKATIAKAAANKGTNDIIQAQTDAQDAVQAAADLAKSRADTFAETIAGIKAETAAIIAHGMALKDSNVTLEEAELQKNILLALADAGISAASEEGKAFAKATRAQADAAKGTNDLIQAQNDAAAATERAANMAQSRADSFVETIAGLKAETALIIAHGKALKDSNVTLEEAALQKKILQTVTDAGYAVDSARGKAIAKQIRDQAAANKGTNDLIQAQNDAAAATERALALEKSREESFAATLNSLMSETAAIKIQRMALADLNTTIEEAALLREIALAQSNAEVTAESKKGKAIEKNLRLRYEEKNLLAEALDRRNPAEQKPDKSTGQLESLAETLNSLMAETAAIKVQRLALADLNTTIEESELLKRIHNAQIDAGYAATSKEGLAIEKIIRLLAQENKVLAEALKLRDQITDAKLKIAADEAQILADQKQNAEEFSSVLVNGFDDAVLSGKSFIDVLEDVGQELLRLVQKRTLLLPLKNLLDDIFISAQKGAEGKEGAGLLKGLFTGAVSAIAGAFGGGGGTLKAGDIGTFSARAKGGPVSKDQPYLVGEEGQELFVPKSAGTIIPNSDLFGSAGQGTSKTIMSPSDVSENPSGKSVFNVDMRGASIEAVRRLETLVREIDGSIEQRSIAAVSTGRSRNPALFGGA